MTREDKNQAIEVLTEKLNEANIFYLADIAGLDAESSSDLRRNCFKSDVEIEVVKNTVLRKALEKADGEYAELYEA